MRDVEIGTEKKQGRGGGEEGKEPKGDIPLEKPILTDYVMLCSGVLKRSR